MAQGEFLGLASEEEIARDRKGLATLTPTERKVLGSVLKYGRLDLAATQMSMPMATIKKYQGRILRRTGLRSLLQLLIFAHVIGYTA